MACKWDRREHIVRFSSILFPIIRLLLYVTEHTHKPPHWPDLRHSNEYMRLTPHQRWSVTEVKDRGQGRTSNRQLSASLHYTVLQPCLIHLSMTESQPKIKERKEKTTKERKQETDQIKTMEELLKKWTKSNQKKNKRKNKLRR